MRGTVGSPHGLPDHTWLPLSASAAGQQQRVLCTLLLPHPTGTQPRPRWGPEQGRQVRRSLIPSLPLHPVGG